MEDTQICVDVGSVGKTRVRLNKTTNAFEYKIGRTTYTEKTWGATVAAIEDHFEKKHQDTNGKAIQRPKFELKVAFRDGSTQWVEFVGFKRQGSGGFYVRGEDGREFPVAVNNLSNKSVTARPLPADMTEKNTKRLRELQYQIAELAAEAKLLDGMLTVKALPSVGYGRKTAGEARSLEVAFYEALKAGGQIR